MDRMNGQELDRVFELHPSPLFEIGKDGAIIRVNDRVREVLGYDRDLKGEKFSSLLAGDAAEKFIALMEKSLSKGGISSELLSLKSSQGEQVFNCEFLPVWSEGSVSSLLLSVIIPEKPKGDGSLEDILKMKLKEEREFIKSVINKSNLLIYSLDTMGNIEIFNKRLEELTGYTKEDCPVLDSLLERFYPDEKYRQVIAKVHQNFAQNQHLRGTELTLTTKNGNLLTVVWNTTRIKNIEGKVVGYIAMGYDVSEKKKLQQWVKLQSSVFDKVSDAIIVLDIKGNILTWSGNARNIFGYTSEEILGKPLKLLFLEGERELIHNTFLKSIRESGRYQSEVEAIDRSGRVIPISINASGILGEKGKMIAIVAVAKDLTEKKEFLSEIENLREKVSRLEGEISTISGGRAALEQAVQELTLFQIQTLDIENMALLTLDLEGRVTSFSRGAEMMTGVVSADAIGKKVCEEVFLLSEWTFEKLVQGLDKERSSVIFSTKLLDKADGGIPVSVEFRGLFDEQGELLNCILFAIEITEEERLTSIIKELSRLAIIGELTLGISHEIDSSFNYLVTNYAKLKEYTKNVIDLIKLYRNGAALNIIEGLVRNIRLNDMLKDMEDIIVDSMNGILRVRNLAKDLKLYTPAGEKEVIYFNINEVLEASLSLMRRRLENRVNLVKEYGITPVISANLNAVYRILINLFYHTAGNFETDDPEKNQVRIITGMDEDGVRVEVVDTGRPLNSAMVEIVNSDRELPTSFLLEYPGLYFARELTLEIGGRFLYEKSENEGNIYNLRFPLAKEEVAEEVTLLPEIEKRGKILFIDDDRSQLNAYIRYFDKDFEVSTANSYSEAMELFKGKKDFNVIFFDLFMPESLGIRFFQEVSERYPALAERFVFVTGEGLTDEGRSFLLNTKKIVLIKPVNMATLNSIVDYVIEREMGISIDFKEGVGAVEAEEELEEELVIEESKEEPIIPEEELSVDDMEDISEERGEIEEKEAKGEEDLEDLEVMEGDEEMTKEEKEGGGEKEKEQDEKNNKKPSKKRIKRRGKGGS